VRKLVGYHRLSGGLQYRLLKDLYRVWSLWRNYFQPVMRLASKTRRGSQVHRRYDMPATPYQRLLASGQLSQAARESLQQRYASLNPIQLRQQIEQRQNELLRTLRRSETRPDSVRKLTPSFGYFFRDPTGGRSVTGGNDLTRTRMLRQTMPAWRWLRRVRTRQCGLYDH
jgi:hypothetical protein